MRGKFDDPLELRSGETVRHYFIFANSLATGETLSGSPTISGDGVTLAGAAYNSTPLTYDGVEYDPNTVAYVDVSGIRTGDKVEITCQATTTTANIRRESMWLRGVANYSD